MWFDHPWRWKNELNRPLRHTLCEGRVNEWGFNSLKSSMKSFKHRALCKGRVNEWGFNSLKSSMKSFKHRVETLCLSETWCESFTQQHNASMRVWNSGLHRISKSNECLLYHTWNCLGNDSMRAWNSDLHWNSTWNECLLYHTWNSLCELFIKFIFLHEHMHLHKEATKVYAILWCNVGGEHELLELLELSHKGKGLQLKTMCKTKAK